MVFCCHPLPPLSRKDGALLPHHAVRRPGYLPTRRPMGFAPPPHDEFALLASAHTRMRLLATQPTIGARVASPGLEGGQVAVLLFYAAVSWPRNECTILL